MYVQYLLKCIVVIRSMYLMVFEVKRWRVLHLYRYYYVNIDNKYYCHHGPWRQHCICICNVLILQDNTDRMAESDERLQALIRQLQVTADARQLVDTGCSKQEAEQLNELWHALKNEAAENKQKLGK